ncbi:MAG: DUF3667 domain-containing protein [Brevundimonas sp.]|uniref:DUF3667 domain-containing protein n=1 Tax=Brevundimonas sp. TaxID=1871086 RepID=UPI00184CA489|nr:DUF3667 domain-containing protein [Brevundimonas sp.]MBA4805732.1 DUF3667 domain-containing protein [Brevundimonas sp.]
MSMEDAGAAVSAGLVAATLERPSGSAGEHQGTCSDCGAHAPGKFCAECGQPTHVHRTLLHLGEELLHGVMHFDARIWRTLPLLALNPGRLTREWVQGARTRYVSPLALFLFTIFVTFFILSFVRMPEPVMSLAGRQAAAEVALDEAAAEAEQARQRVVALESEATPEPGALAEARAALQEAAAERDERVADLERLTAAAGPDQRGDGLAPGSWQAGLKDWAAGIYQSENAGPTAKKMARKLQNPDLAVYKLQQTLYKFAFLLVPLSIPFMAVLFLHHRRVSLYDHGVFVLYSLTFMALLGLVVSGLLMINGWLGGLAWMASCFLVPAHIFAQLKGAYSLSWFSALWRFVFLVLFCNIVLGLFLWAVIWLGLGV